MSNFKIVVLSLGSALIGGLIVAGVIFWKPTFVTGSPNVSTNKDQEEPINLNSPSTEKDLFESMDKYQNEMRSQFDSFFNDDFFSQDDPFEAMRKFRQRMQKDMQDFNSPSFSTPFDSWFGNKFGGGTVQDIEKREDENFVYYDIKVKDVKGTTVNTKVENGYLTITGQIESKKSEQDEESGFSNSSVFSSTFSRTFPLPADVDADSMEMESEQNKITIKFPKKEI